MNRFTFKELPRILPKKIILSLLLFTACESKAPEQEDSTPSPSDVAATLPSEIKTLPGFEAQLLYEVPRGSQGTWVSLTVGPYGDLIASDQSEKGLFIIKVGNNPDKPDVTVEEITMPLSGANGLVWAYNHLYANVPGKGIFRLRATLENGEFNVMEFLGGPEKLAEHGNHGVMPAPDNQSLFIINGNYTPAPNLTSSRLLNWQEDLLLPRQWDISGNARGIYAPGGYIAKTNPEATEWEMFSIGYRNPYDAAINQHGELFTFDSDMEWDLGMPWYRPTRLIHVVSGSDYGWRSGSGKWKEYYEDSLPPMLNIGRGSPTGLVFGTGAHFPSKYQHALFALDWIYGTIYAFHITPDGASYNAEIEEFLTGSPLPMTDVVIGHDGALYFITGGRANDSKLYRVVYLGNESTEPAPLPVDEKTQKAREVRRKLESFHGKQNPGAVNTAWPHLASADRFIRHAARVAIESQPADTWAEQALKEKHTQARITALTALARSGANQYRDKAIDALLELDFSALDNGQKLGYLRTMALIFMRLGDPDKDLRNQITNALHELLPANDHSVNTELVRLLVYLEDSRVIEKALALMQSTEEAAKPNWAGLLNYNDGTVQKMMGNPPPTRKIEYAFMLRNLREGWTVEQRREYFTFINEAANRIGGSSYSGILQKIRDEALSNTTEKEHEAVSDITGVNLIQEPPFKVIPPKGPGREWTIHEALGAVADHRTNRDFENGRNAFFTTGCASCHRFNGFGGNIGPDLSTIGRRSSIPVLLEDIIEPNALISDQYSSSVVKLKNGDAFTGLVVEEDLKIKIYPRNTNQAPTEVAKNEISSIEQAYISQMPAGLINSLSADELRNLIAYLKSGGNPNSKYFKGN